VERGLAEKQAFRLTAGQGEATLERMRAIIAHFDALVAQKSPLISRSPTGFLYRAVERPFEFTLPGERRVKQVQPSLIDANNDDERPSESMAGRGQKGRGAHDRDSTTTSDSKEDKVDLEVEYLTARSQRLQDVRARTSADERDQVRREVEQALSKLRAHISPQRFTEAVEHGVDQRLLDAHGFPEFEAWVQKRG
jgi:ElaB/YqjD/DUF883 family membrane-anchored ribosome-binding protein